MSLAYHRTSSAASFFWRPVRVVLLAAASMEIINLQTNYLFGLS